MKELDLQARLVKDTKARNGWARKMAQKHEAGMPDLLLKMRRTEVVFVECKMDKLSLSELQRETIRRMQKAGMFVGWLVYDSSASKANNHVVWVGADPGAKDFDGDNSTMIILSGKVWDTTEVIKAVDYWSFMEFGL